MKMKTFFTCMLAAMLSLALADVSRSEDLADTLYKQAYTAEAVDREPGKAIDLYKQVLAQTADQNPLAAKAHLRMGICYEKLGRTDDARLSYQNVLDMGEAPAAIVQQARDHVQRLQPVAVQPSPSLEPVRSVSQVESNRDAEKPYQRGLFELSLQSGISWTNVDYGPFWFHDNPAVAPLFQFSGLYELTPWLSMGAEIGYPTEHKVNTKNRVVGNASEASGTKRKITQFTPEIQVGPWIGRIKPYLTVGGGLYRVTDVIDLSVYNPDVPFGFATVAGSDTRNLGGFNAGLGILFRVGDYMAVGPDFRYHRIFDAGENYYYGTASARIAVLF